MLSLLKGETSQFLELYERLCHQVILDKTFYFFLDQLLANFLSRVFRELDQQRLALPRSELSDFPDTIWVFIVQMSPHLSCFFMCLC